MYNVEAREKIFRGINKLANAVKVTLGPKGRYVAVDEFSSPQIINDGVTIAKSISLKDRRENVGAKLIKEVASKTQEEAGDGTTTATVLAQAIAREGLKIINSGANPIEVKKGIDKATRKVIEVLKSKAVEVSGKDQIAQVATISANNDEEIGNLIAEAMDKVGNDGVITVEEAGALETSVEVVEGMEFDRGYVSPYMITDAEKKVAELKEPYILVTDQSISSLQDILEVLQYVTQESRPLLIIADDVEGEALTGLVINILRGTLKVVAVKAPGFGDDKKEKLKDIAYLTGARAIIKDEGLSIKDVTPSDLGSADKVKVTNDKTTIIGGKGKELNERIEVLRKQLKEAKDSEKESLRKRLAALTGGVAVLKIGAATEVEMKEKKHRVDDALNATRAAVEEGIVVGGGVALLKAAQEINLEDYDGDEKLGAQIIKKALEMPFRTIVENGGIESSIIVNKVLSEESFNFGYNAKTDQYEDLMKAGVIDPVKVTRLCLQNAASIAGLLLTTEALIVECDEKKDKKDDDLDMDF